MILIQRLNVQLRIPEQELPDYERQGFKPVALPEEPGPAQPEKAAKEPAKGRSKSKQ